MIIPHMVMQDFGRAAEPSAMPLIDEVSFIRIILNDWIRLASTFPKTKEKKNKFGVNTSELIEPPPPPPRRHTEIEKDPGTKSEGEDEPQQHGTTKKSLGRTPNHLTLRLAYEQNQFFRF